MGRFTAKDPIGYTGGDYDLWDYCVDDPISMNDPSGLIGRNSNSGFSDLDVWSSINELPSALVHGLIKGANNALALIHDTADTMRDLNIGPKGHVRIDISGKGPILSWQEGNVPAEARMHLPNVSAPEGTAGKIASEVGQFITGLIPAGRTASGINAVSKVGKAAKALGVGAAADFLSKSPDDPLLSDVIEQIPSLSNIVTGMLASKNDDSPFARRAKHAIEGMTLGGATEAAIPIAKKGVGIIAENSRPILDAGADVLEGVGLKAKTAEAAMYKAREANVVDFRQRVLVEGGSTKKSFFEMQEPQGFFKDYPSVRIPSDTVKHVKNNHPDITDNDWVKLSEIMGKVENVRKSDEIAMYGGKTYFGTAKIAEQQYGLIWEVQQNGNAIIKTFFKDNTKKMNDWLEKK